MTTIGHSSLIICSVTPPRQEENRNIHLGTTYDSVLPLGFYSTKLTAEEPELNLAGVLPTWPFPLIRGRGPTLTRRCGLTIE
jgi:hypothetical protein